MAGGQTWQKNEASDSDGGSEPAGGKKGMRKVEMRHVLMDASIAVKFQALNMKTLGYFALAHLPIMKTAGNTHFSRISL